MLHPQTTIPYTNAEPAVIIEHARVIFSWHHWSRSRRCCMVTGSQDSDKRALSFVQISDSLRCRVDVPCSIFALIYRSCVVNAVQTAIATLTIQRYRWALMRHAVQNRLYDWRNVHLCTADNAEVDIIISETLPSLQTFERSDSPKLWKPKRIMYWHLLVLDYFSILKRIAECITV